MEIRHFGKTNAYIMTVQKCKLCFPQNDHSDRCKERERERETDRQRHTQKDRQTEKQRQRETQNDRQTDKQREREREREREGESLGKGLLFLRIIMLKYKKTSCFTQTFQFEKVSQISFSIQRKIAITS